MRSIISTTGLQSRLLSRFSSTIVGQPLQVVASPGSRVLELSNPESGNKITESLCATMMNKLEHLEDNKTVAAVFIASYSPDYFSSGLETPEVIASANKLSAKLSNFKKQTVAVFSGEVNASSYGVFAGCTFRLGTPSTKFSIDSLMSSETLPRGGGLAYHLARSSVNGVAMARYLAVTGRPLSAHDMRELGLLTHIVEEEPHVSLTHSLAHTIPQDDYIKSEQTAAVDGKALAQLLDTMDVNDISDDVQGMMDHELWDKMMLVKPIPVSDHDLFGGEAGAKNGAGVDLEDHAEGISECFGGDDVTECKSKLEKMTSEAWARQALEQLNGTSPQLLQTWFKLTRVAANEPIEFVYKAEERK